MASGIDLFDDDYNIVILLFMKHLFWLFPELLIIALLIYPKSRSWVIRMIEDSDGDPNHTDGFFIAVLWCGTVCIRVSCAIAIHDVFTSNNSQNFTYVATFLTSGAALLGVRGIRSFKLPTKKDHG